MQALNRGMLGRYDIPEHMPSSVNIVQFGLGEALLATADRLIEAACPGLGIACVCPPDSREGDLLKRQDGLFTLLVRGYEGEAPVKDEVVVQSVVRVIDDDAGLDALALSPQLSLALIDTRDAGTQAALVQAARLIDRRHRAGMGGLGFICLGERADCAALTAAALAALAPEAAAECRFYPALADSLAFRADADEAARQCAEMNYADGMLHIAEPFARLTVQAPEGALGLAASPRLRFVDDLAPVLAQRRRLYDGALFAMAAPGWLLGCDTLCACMRHERLRAFVGRCVYDELLPRDADARDADAPYVIECFERFENPLNKNALLRAAKPLLSRFAAGALPIIRDHARARFEPPRRLSFALAATIMLYAGARPDRQGRYTVARGEQTEPLVDDPEALAVFAAFSHDMPPETLAYAALADRELWGGADLRDIDGLEARVALDIANIQRQPQWLPEERVESGVWSVE